MFWFGNKLDKLQPLDPIIVAMCKEIAGDGKIEPSADTPGGEHGCKDDDAAKEHRELEHQSPIAAKPAQQHAHDSYREEETAARTQGRGVQHDLPGNMNVDPPFAVASHGQREERGHECCDERAS